jgi:hypothetical protein
MSEVLDVPAAPAPPASGPDSPARCHNCETPLAGPFCHACGQLDQPLDLPAREIARGALGDVFAWDGRFWGTVRLLLARPGFLSAEWADGRRVRYIPPLRLYVIATVLFVVTDAVNGLAVDWLHDTRHAAAEAETHPDDEDENSFEGFVPAGREGAAAAYMERSLGLGLRWFFVVMPLGGFGLYVLYHNQRPSYATHFVLAIHVFVVVILALAVTEVVKMAFVLVPPHETFGHAVPGGNGWFLLAAFVGSYVYAALAVRRFYGVPAWKAALSAPAVTVVPALAWFGIIIAGLMVVLAWPG